MQDYLLGALSEEQMNQLPTENVYWSLKRNMYSVLIGITIQICFGILWQLAAIVPGFALYNGVAGEVSAYTHLAWWFIIDYLCVCFGLCAVWFGLGYSNTQGMIEKNVSSTKAWLETYRFILALAGVAHIVHVVLTGIELNNNSSTLATQYKWVLIVLIVLLSASVLLVAWLIYRTQVYLQNLTTAMRTNRIDMSLSLGRNDEERGGDVEDQQQQQPAALQPPTAAGSRITTPLLAQLQTNKRIVHKLK